MNQSNSGSLFENHGRDFQANRYVYPVLSRRAGGISIGVNLNRDKVCNFACAYCQVDRSTSGEKAPVQILPLVEELDRMVELVTSGRIYEQAKFRDVPQELRRLNDVALSGDGEPTAVANFEEVVHACAEVRRRHGLDDVKLVLITNASMLHRDNVRQALDVLDANHGEIWAKLDAGTEAHFRKVARTRVPWQRILDNLRATAIARPIVIQSLFMRMYGEPPPSAEQDAYCDRLNEILTSGGRIKMVQIHTVARAPTESWVAALSDAQVDEIAQRVRQQTGLSVASYYGK